MHYELDVEDLGLSDVVERLVVEMDFKSEGCIVGLFSVCTPLETVFTACTVVQAVVKATSQSNGKSQILTPPGLRNP